MTIQWYKMLNSPLPLRPNIRRCLRFRSCQALAVHECKPVRCPQPIWMWLVDREIPEPFESIAFRRLSKWPRVLWFGFVLIRSSMTSQPTQLYECAPFSSVSFFMLGYVTYFNNVEFVIFCGVAQQKLTHNQFVEWIWKFFCITNNVPFHTFVGCIKCGGWNETKIFFPRFLIHVNFNMNNLNEFRQKPHVEIQYDWMAIDKILVYTSFHETLTCQCERMWNAIVRPNKCSSRFFIENSSFSIQNTTHMKWKIYWKIQFTIEIIVHFCD